jgi:hypothetical protein
LEAKKISPLHVVHAENAHFCTDSETESEIHDTSCREPFATEIGIACEGSIFQESRALRAFSENAEDFCGVFSARNHNGSRALPTPNPENSQDFCWSPSAREHDLRRALPALGVADADDLDERAALLTEGAGVPRAWAQGFAALCAVPPPPGFWPERWQRVIDAVGAFLDRWATEASRCGWSDLDLFGCHDTAPDRRYDAMKLVLHLEHCEVVAIDAEGADLVTVAGARQRFRRRPLPAGTVPLWHLVR